MKRVLAMAAMGIFLSAAVPVDIWATGAGGGAGGVGGASSAPNMGDTGNAGKGILHNQGIKGDSIKNKANDVVEPLQKGVDKINPANLFKD